MGKRNKPILKKEVIFPFGSYHVMRFIKFELFKLKKVKSWTIVLLMPMLLALYIYNQVSDEKSSLVNQITLILSEGNLIISKEREIEWMQVDMLIQNIVGEKPIPFILVIIFIMLIVNGLIAWGLHWSMYKKVKEVQIDSMMNYVNYDGVKSIEQGRENLNLELTNILNDIQNILDNINTNPGFKNQFLNKIISIIELYKNKNENCCQVTIIQGVNDLSCKYEDLELNEKKLKYLLRNVIYLKKAIVNKRYKLFPQFMEEEFEDHLKIKNIVKAINGQKLDISNMIKKNKGEKIKLKKILKKARYKKRVTNFNVASLERLLKLVLTPDLHYADLYKKKIKEDINFEFILEELKINGYKCGHLTDLCKIDKVYTDNDGIKSYIWSLIKVDRKFYIEWCNWANILLSVGYLTIAYIINLPLVKTFNIFGVSLSTLLIITVLFRIISRGGEVAFAFYKDVTRINSKIFYEENKEGEKIICYIDVFNKSLLRNRGRLSLAIHTLVEMFILYGTIYYLLFSLSDEFSLHIFEAMLFSVSLGLFNFSYFNYGDILLSILHVSQVIISVVLILLSIAQYLSSEELSEEEANFYAKVKEEKESVSKKLNV